MTFRNWLAVTGVCALTAFGACGEDEKDGDDDTGENTCKPDQTYQAVGKPFIDKYCISCHSKDSDDRVGAPEDINFDDLAGIRDHGMHIFDEVREEEMPPKAADEQPDGDARAPFLEWLECEGISKLEHDH